MVGYFEDGENLVIMVMNGWLLGVFVWWLNVQVYFDIDVIIVDGC